MLNDDHATTSRIMNELLFALIENFDISLMRSAAHFSFKINSYCRGFEWNVLGKPTEKCTDGAVSIQQYCQ